VNDGGMKYEVSPNLENKGIRLILKLQQHMQIQFRASLPLWEGWGEDSTITKHNEILQF
jgi:hypothetical protein